jgi:hypothetical protein
MTSTGIEESPELKPGLRFIRRCRRFGIDADHLKELIEQAIADTDSNLEEFHDRCNLIGLLGNEVARRHGSQRWGLKIMREIRGAQRYIDVWPNGKLIHIVRDGRDVAASQVFEHSSWGYQSLDEAATKWEKLIEQVGTLADQGLIQEIRYEDLVYKPVQILQEVVEYIGVRWNQVLLDYYKRARIADSSVRHPSAEAVAQPLNDSAIGRYKRDLDSEQTATFCSIAGGALRRHGYL